MISGVHGIIYSKDAEQTRAFFRDVLGFPFVDAGHGWLIFALPPAELGIHPDEDGGTHEFYLMCDDVHAAVEELKSKGVEFTMSVTDQGYGLMTRFRLPGAGQMGLYQPKHPTALSQRS